jgi:threonine dehydratase
MPMRAAQADGRAITLADIRAAAGRISGAVLRTPTLESQAVSRATGARVFLKLDNLQATGAFKERGAANRLALLTARERAAGVIAMSAGNHAQAVARHASLAGIAATIVMPKFTPATKVTRTEAWGARVELHGTTLAEAAAHAQALAAAEGQVIIHPYDDAAVIAAGFSGFTLGSTPTAMANMTAVTQKFGPSPKAFIVLPLVSAFFIDLLNAVLIPFFLHRV